MLPQRLAQVPQLLLQLRNLPAQHRVLLLQALVLLFKREQAEAGVEVDRNGPSSWEVEAGGSRIQGQPGLHQTFQMSFHQNENALKKAQLSFLNQHY